MDDIRQERPNEGQIFNLYKKLYRQSLNKKFRTLVKRSMVLNSKKLLPVITHNKA